jgi:hypothetical protein
VEEKLVTVKSIKNLVADLVKDGRVFDYEVIQYKTYIQNMLDGTIDDNVDTTRLDETVYLHQDVRIGQETTIKLKLYNDDEKLPPKLIEVKLGATKDQCDIYADIKLSPESKYTKEQLYSLVIGEINKKKALYDVPIGLFDGSMLEQIPAKVHELTRNFKVRILVSSSPYRPVDTQKAEVREVFIEDRQDVNQQYFQTDPGKVILKVITYKKGHGGRSCFGRYLFFDDFEEGESVNIMHNSQNIQKIDEENGDITYMARKKGLVKYENGELDIKDSLMLDEVSSKTTGEIDLSSVNVFIKTKNDANDAIGSGSVLETKKLEMTGNVGSDSRIKSQSVDIKGATHQSSRMHTERARIKIHKGYLKTVSAEIDTLEHGLVEGKEVIVGEMLGGNIRADTVIIKNIPASFADVLAFKKIVLDNVTGDENIFRIRYGLNQEDILAMDDMKKKVGFITKEVKKLNVAIDQNRQYFITHKRRIEDISGIPRAKMTIVQQRMSEAIEKTKTLITELEYKKGMLQVQKESLEEKLAGFVKNIHSTEVRIKACAPNNIIEFTIYKDGEDKVLRYVTTADDSFMRFFIDENMKIRKERI